MMSAANHRITQAAGHETRLLSPHRTVCSYPKTPGMQQHLGRSPRMPTTLASWLQGTVPLKHPLSSELLVRGHQLPYLQDLTEGGAGGLGPASSTYYRASQRRPPTAGSGERVKDLRSRPFKCCVLFKRVVLIAVWVQA